MRSKIIAIRLTDEMVDKIDDVSNGLFISRSDFIRMAVAKQLNKHFQKQKDQDLDWEQLFSDKI